MTASQKKTVLIAAIIAGLLSIPLPWFSMRAVMPGGIPGGLFQPLLQNATMTVTALNGSVSFLAINTPIWLLVLVAVGASGLQLVRRSKIAEIPPAIEWAMAVFAAIWLTIPILFALLSGGVTPGIGWLLGLASAAGPLACLLLRETTAVMPDQSSPPLNTPLS